MADNKSREGERSTDIEIPKPPKDAKVNIDLSNAIKDLKAIQREARKATAALKEFEQAYNKVKPVANQFEISGQEFAALIIKSRGDHL